MVSNKEFEEIVEDLKSIAASEMYKKEGLEDFCEIYNGGFDDGQIILARELLEDMGIEW